MRCERCDGHCIVEDIKMPMWRCVNCGGRHEAGKTQAAIRQYQTALVEILATPANATAIAEKALGLNRAGPHEVRGISRTMDSDLPRPKPRIEW